MRGLHFVCGIGISTIAAGCLGEPAPEPKVSTKINALFVDSSAIWPKLHIPVCFENPSDGNASGRGWVQDAVTDTWQAHSKVVFTGWGRCSSDATGIRIRIEDVEDAPHTDDLGRNIDGEEDGMSLNFTFHNWNSKACEASSAHESCVKAIAVHEFGHALGFAHEQNRDDTPASCDQAQGDDGDTTVGAWDVGSVMNYCNPVWNNGGVLSSTDIRGLQAYYGHPDAASMRIAAVNLGQDKFYFFRGGLYSRVDGDSRVMDSGYPKTISSNWGNWPAGWDDGIDAALNWDFLSAYFFRGSQYVKVDIASKTVIGTPRTTSTFWGNWPTGWNSVDAAIDWGNGKYYFFRGDKYIRYDKATDRVDPNYPKLISDKWGGLFSANIDSAFNDGDGKAYFFNGNIYDRVDIDDDEHDVDEGYPANIVGNWPGVLF